MKDTWHLICSIYTYIPIHTRRVLSVCSSMSMLMRVCVFLSVNASINAVLIYRQHADLLNLKSRKNYVEKSKAYFMALSQQHFKSFENLSFCINKNFYLFTIFYLGTSSLFCHF